MKAGYGAYMKTWMARPSVIEPRISAVLGHSRPRFG